MLKRVFYRIFKFTRGRYLKNIFKSESNKKVLICYLAAPFVDGPGYSHTNSFEVIEIAKCFSSKGYAVDVVDYNYKKPIIDYNSYDVVFGFGYHYYKAITLVSKSIKIFYGTGCFVYFHNFRSFERQKEFMRRKKRFLEASLRIEASDYGGEALLSDAIVVFGNKHTKDTYVRYFRGPIVKVNGSFIKVHTPELLGKDYAKARKNFLWIGGMGMIHKGLDVLLEAFSMTKEANLHICGPIEGEGGFRELFQEELYQLPNVFTHGFVDISTLEFKAILQECAYVILPSCAEGQNTSVLNAMGNGGLIPVLTLECGIDLDDFGYLIESISVETIIPLILKLSQLEVTEVREKSIRTYNKTVDKNSISGFSHGFGQALNEILVRE